MRSYLTKQQEVSKLKLEQRIQKIEYCKLHSIVKIDFPKMSLGNPGIIKFERVIGRIIKVLMRGDKISRDIFISTSLRERLSLWKDKDEDLSKIISISREQ